VKDNPLELLGRGELLICDGAFGTQIQQRGLEAGAMPELWNVDHQDVVRDIHREYMDAGAQIVTANTFGANRPRLAHVDASDRVAELNRLGIEIARSAVDDNAWVGASIGPTGEMLEPYGTLSVDDAEAIYREQIRAVAHAGADIILLETHHDLQEISAALRAAKSVCDLPVFATFAFNTKGRTMMGLKPDVAAQEMAKLGADAVGANCGDGPAAVTAALEGMIGAADLPLIAQANAGIPQADAHGQASWDVSPEEMAEHVVHFVDLGARIVGGCCGTGPAHIAAIVAAVKS